MKFTCGQCAFFVRQDNIEAVGVAPQGEKFGMCAIEPPTMHMIPVPINPKTMLDVRSDGRREMTLVPSPVERFVSEARHCCRYFHPELGVSVDLGRH